MKYKTAVPLILNLFHDTHPFYKRLIGAAAPSNTACEEIKEEIKASSLLVCSDGAYHPADKCGSHGWVFAVRYQVLLLLVQDLLMDILHSSHPTDRN